MSKMNIHCFYIFSDLKQNLYLSNDFIITCSIDHIKDNLLYLKGYYIIEDAKRHLGNLPILDRKPGVLVMMKISFISTVFNEEDTIIPFLNSLCLQSKIPNEIIIVDGGSTDKTLSIISNFPHSVNSGQEFPISKNKVKIIRKIGNRSVGRNEAIRQASGDVILCSDAGCILDKDWIKNITKPFEKMSIDVVAGYYKGDSKNIFQKCLIPYVLVMPDKIDENNFLPASRSMAFKKSVWKRAGEFPEEFSNNEDYVFAKQLKKIKANIVFEKKAIVYWKPRSNIKDTFIMFYRFAKGDAESHIFRPKVIILFSRYIIVFFLFSFYMILKSFFVLNALYLILISYTLWSVVKNYKYVKNPKAFLFLPVIQISSDIAVLTGTIAGIMRRMRRKFASCFMKDKYFLLILIIYVALSLSVINWGIPNRNHPFTYHMDEWHFSQAIRSIVKYGTTTKDGVAQIPFFHPVSAGLFISPFIFLKIIDLSSIKHSVENLQTQMQLFQVLRLHTLLFGILSLFILKKIAQILKISVFFTTSLFAFTPIWLTLSNYFKYDIVLVFWILTSLMFLLRYISQNTRNNYVLSGLAIGMALATKFTALPLVLIYFICFFIFNKRSKKNLRDLLLGFIVCFLTFVLIGIPHLLTGKADYRELFNSVVLNSPNDTYNYALGINYWFYLGTKQLMAIFGHPLYVLFLFSMVALTVRLIVNFKNRNNILYKNELFIFISLLIFVISLIPLKISATGNRALVLLPFLSIISSIFLGKIINSFKNYRKFLFILIGVLLIVQSVEFFSWVYIKWSKDPREVSSVWIENNIPKKSTIGIENIPIYQMLPDVILKEYYSSDKNANQYKYEVVNSENQKLPQIIIMTNVPFYSKYVLKSPKKDLLKRLEMEGYKSKINFYPNWGFNQVLINKLDFYISGLIPIPIISVFEKI